MLLPPQKEKEKPRLQLHGIYLANLARAHFFVVNYLPSSQPLCYILELLFFLSAHSVPVFSAQHSCQGSVNNFAIPTHTIWYLLGSSATFHLPIRDKAVFPGDRTRLLPFVQTPSSQLDQSDYKTSLFQITQALFKAAPKHFSSRGCQSRRSLSSLLVELHATSWMSYVQL